MSSALLLGEREVQVIYNWSKTAKKDQQSWDEFDETLFQRLKEFLSAVFKDREFTLALGTSLESFRKIENAKEAVSADGENK